MQITIRVANSADLAAIHGLVRELAIFENAESAFTASLEDYKNDFEAGVFEAHVAEADGQVIGMILYYMAYSTWKGKMLFLEDFVVTEAYRRFGVGQLLFDTFLAVAKEKDARLTKWQVLDWNKPAQLFYTKNKAILETDWWNGKIIF